MPMPALGLGYPVTSGLMAFVENFIRSSTSSAYQRSCDIVHRLGARVEPRRGPHPRRLDRTPRWFLVPQSWDSSSRISRPPSVSGIGTGLLLVGAIFLVALIWWIEERIAYAARSISPKGARLRNTRNIVLQPAWSHRSNPTSHPRDPHSAVAEERRCRWRSIGPPPRPPPTSATRGSRNASRRSRASRTRSLARTGTRSLPSLSRRRCGRA